MDANLAKTLYMWARCNSERQLQLETWLDDALTAIAQGHGSSVISTTANGVTVSFATKGLTNTEWANTISKALEYIENNGPKNRVIGTVL